MVVLVPSIALVSQIKREFQKLARRDRITIRTLAICSDVSAGRTQRNDPKFEERVNLAADPTKDVSQLRAYEVVGDTATNEQQVIDWLNNFHGKTEANFLALFSTYQSSHNTAKGLRELGLKADLLICDEAHRTAGIKKIPKNGERLRNFTLCHDKDQFPATFRIYQTATPKVYTNASNRQVLLDADDAGWDVRSMNDPSTFGAEFYRLSYVDAVNRNLLSDYRIIAWGISEREADEAQKIADELNAAAKSDEATETRWDRSMAMRVLTLAAFVAGCVPNVEIRSVIAFCNRVKMSSELARAVVSKPVQSWLKSYFQRLGLAQPPATIRVEHVDATFSSIERHKALHELGTATNQTPFCVSNVGIFGEGTDSPGLSAVAFLNPRKSPVDVIQAVGRAMRKSPEKTFGYILVPVIIPDNYDPESFLRNSSPSHGWEELGQILQALRAHDGRIEDHLESLMEFYVPPPSKEPDDHLVVIKEPYRKPEIFLIHTNTPTVEQIIAPKRENDPSTIQERLCRDKGTLSQIEDPSELESSKPPKSVSVVVRDKDGSTGIKDMTFTVIPPGDGTREERSWDPQDVVERTKEFILADRPRRKKQIRRVPPKRKRETDHQTELGLKLLHLEKDKLAESGIHLNLLEKSGIQGGAERDVNLLEGTVSVVARHLRDADLEEIFAVRLGMENVERSSQGTADACTVTAIIWLNAAIMHARLEQSGIKHLKLNGVKELKNSIANVTPAIGLMEAWRNVLIMDYVPIFKIAIELLQDVAFQNLESVSDALRHLVKNALNIAEHYANLGMDHAGKLFNSVMGNQRADGAFFTRPIAATMLAELALSASGDRNYLDEESWDSLRCFDPACGSGTILVAMMSAIKRRINLAGGNEDTLKRFHRRAVERLIVGADINHVALQLAACQLTLGNLGVAYDQINLHLMDYGPINPDVESSSVKTGTVELLLDERLFPNRDELSGLNQESKNLRLDMEGEEEETSLGDHLVDSPVSFVLMNPPFTPWTSIGTKYDRAIQQKIRKRLAAIWDKRSGKEPLLNSRKTTPAPLFESMAISITARSDGIIGLVRPSIIATTEDAREVRKTMANLMHIEFILTSHDPTNFNMSWDTNINECLIVMSNLETNKNEPTRFINLHRFPDTVEEAYEQIHKALSGASFNGSSVLWDYERMKEGDWTPAAFSECGLATLANDALSATDYLTYELINSGRGGWHLLDSISRSDAHFEVSLAGGDWRMTATPTRRYEHFDHKTPNAEPVIAGVGKESQTQLKGRVTKWIKLTKLPREREQEYQRRLQKDKENIKKYRSHLLLAKRFDTSGARLVALASEKQFIGYGWMPVLGKEPITYEFSKAIVIWLNSTLGRLALRRVSGAKISFPQLSPINFDAVPFVDIRNTDVVRVLCECFEDTCDELVPQFRDGRVPIRETWDDAVAIALDIDRELIAKCADMLARDAFVSKDVFYEQM